MTLTDGVRVELTVAERAGIARFTFPDGADAGLTVNAGSSANSISNKDTKPHDLDAFASNIRVLPDGSFTGSVSAGRFCGSDSSYKLYVAGRFNKQQQDSALLWQENSLEKNVATGKHTGAWFRFGKQHEVLLKVGISFVSEEGALNNLEKEIPAWDFDRVHAQARATWTELLDRIAVEGGSPDQRKIFYTGLYHSFLSPNLFSDEDGQYIGFDNKPHSLAGTKQKAQYANFSDWDTYRNTVQLQALFEPERESDMMQSLVNDAAQSGWFPRWPAANDVTYVMGGDSPVILLSSASHSARATSMSKPLSNTWSRPAPSPATVRTTTPSGLSSRTTSNSDIRPSRRTTSPRPVHSSSPTPTSPSRSSPATPVMMRNIKSFLKQSENWKNLFDPETHWIRPRTSDGKWQVGFDPERSLPKRSDASDSTDQDGFEEGNTYQYTFMIPFDYPALFAAIGGDAKVEPRLDKFFSKLICWGEPCFNMANEPDFVTPYAYVFAGLPWKTQDVITRIEKETFKTTPDGIPGNDDLGATSGVYVWNALGFYPAVPGVGGIVLGTPMFDKATLRLAGGRTLVVSRAGEGIYVQTVSVDAAPYANSWLPISTIHPGTTTLHFDMSTAPNKQRGSAIQDRPPSFR